MMNAYDKLYLEKAKVALGRMLDFAVYDLKYSLEEFWNYFIESELCNKFERGDSSLISGRSGIEMAYEVINNTKISVIPRFSESRSEEYWTGWALAYFQWESSLSFKEITNYICITDIRKMYHPYHEMDIRQFCEKMMSLYKEKKKETNLKKRRKEACISQRELSELTGIPLRTIQQYEQGQKNINKAQACYVLVLSKVLRCKVENLLEK